MRRSVRVVGGWHRSAARVRITDLIRQELAGMVQVPKPLGEVVFGRPKARKPAALEGFERTTFNVNGVDIVLRHGGKGPPLLLIHGNPFTHLSWNRVAPDLAQHFTVVTPDIRGYGDSSKPDGGGDHYAYSFREMGKDMVEVMRKLGFDTFYAAGHDRGARVLHRMCLDYPE